MGGLASAAVPIADIAYFSPDDAFFYMKTAQQFAAGEGSTFDGFTSTNGYHPLWFLALAGLYWLVQLGGALPPEWLFRLSFFAGWALFIGSSWLTIAAYRRLQPDKGLSSFAVFFIVLCFLLIWARVVGSEAQIACTVFALYVYFKSLELTTGRSFAWPKAFALALLFLARYDFIATLIPALLIGDYFTVQDKKRLRTALPQVLILGIAVIAYFGNNYIQFGHVLTVSGSYKSSFPDVVLFENFSRYLTTSRYQFARAILAIGVAGWFAWHSLRSRNRQPFGLLLSIAGVGGALFLLQTMSFNAHKLREWYTTVPLFIAIMQVTWYLLQRRSAIPDIVNGTLIGGALVFLLLVAGHFEKWDANIEYAETLRSNTAPDDRILIVDCSGIVGFFSERSVVNGDGLVCSYEYMERMKAGTLKSWLAENRVEYYATYTAVYDSSSALYHDPVVTGMGGLELAFGEHQLLHRAPFSIDNILFHSSGEWMMFRFDFDEGRNE